MPTFTYSGYSAEGKRTSGQMSASSRKEAIRLLARKQIQTTQIHELNHPTPRTGQASSSRSNSSQTQTRSESSSVIAAPVPQRRRFSFSSANSTLGLGFLDKLLELHLNGMPAGECIKLMRARVREPELQAIAEGVWRDLSEGHTLASALQAQKGYFSTASIKMIEAGERTGNLGPILSNLVEHLHEQETLRKKLLGGLAYPALVCGLTLIVTTGFLFGLLPKIRDMVDSLGGEMNLVTRLLMAMGEIGIWLFPLFVVIGIFAALSISRWRKTEAGRYTTDGWLLRLPLLGSIAHDNQLFQSMHLLGTLLQSGITLTEAMQLTEQTLGNRHLKDRFHDARISINEGTAMSNAFRETGFLTDLNLDILTIGESVGKVENSLVNIQKRFRESLNSQLNRLTVVITTSALSFAFILVGLTAIGMVMSIFQVSQSLQLK